MEPTHDLYDSANGPDICDHEGTEKFCRVAHGYLGDAPAGTLRLLCADCGSIVASVAR